MSMSPGAAEPAGESRGARRLGTAGDSESGHSTETGFTNACSIVGGWGEIAQAIPAQPPKFQHPAPRNFFKPQKC